MFRMSLYRYLTMMFLLSLDVFAVGIEYEIVNSRKPVCAVIIPSKPTKLESSAADELLRFINHYTETDMKVVRENDYVSDGDKVSIFIGNTKSLQQANLISGYPELEEFNIIPDKGKIYIFGGDDPNDSFHGGTYYGVIYFIENCLNGAFLWPGELGTVYPSGEHLNAVVTKYQFRPPLVSRQLRNAATNRVRFIQHAQKLGFSAQDISNKQEVTSRWFSLRGIASRAELTFGHSFSKWWDQYGQSQPELFALMPGDLRGPIKNAQTRQLRMPQTVKLCVSNPEVAEIIVAGMDNFFRKKPDSLTFPVSINDGRFHGFCMCERCKSWDNLDAESLTLHYCRADGSAYQLKYHFLTDRYARFWSAIASELEKRYPEKLLGVFGYGALEAPPVKESLPSNLAVSFVGPEQFYAYESYRQNTLNRWKGWAKSGVKLVFRPNLLYYGHQLPMVYIHKLDADIKHFYRSGMIGVDFDIVQHCWGTQGLNLYVLSRLVWNPNENLDTIVDDFCYKAFGKAAKPMKQYFELLENSTNKVASKYKKQVPQEVWMRGLCHEILSQNDEKIARCFKKSFNNVAIESPEYKRVELFYEGYHYAMLMNTAFEAFASKNEEKKKTAILELKNYFDKHQKTFVIDMPFLYGRMGSIEQYLKISDDSLNKDL